jgi:hypothetical protein
MRVIMLWLLLFYIMINLAPHALHHNALSSYMAHLFARPRVCVHVPELEELTEQVQVEEVTNLTLD